jgi:FAD/FMN-containing dehydrogenase
MPRWSNWSGKQQSKIQAQHFVRSEDDAAGLVVACAQQGLRVRTAGAGHSHSQVALPDQVAVDLSGLSGVISTDAEQRTAWVWAGSPIYSLGRPLWEAGLALHNQGDIDRQAIAGATATGTHGTGATLGNLSSRVLAAELITAKGQRLTVTESSEPALFQALRTHLGSLGIVTRLQLQLRNAYRLHQRSWSQGLENLLPEIDSHIAENRHFEFFWYPQTDQAHAKIINETEADCVYPLGDDERLAWSYEVLPSHRPVRHTEMEYSIPAEHGIDCLREIQQLLKTRFSDIAWPVEYRTVAADDVWLSAACQRPTVTISVHQDIGADDEPYFRACEAVFSRWGGRPHWGKVNYLSGSELAAIHPQWSHWWQARDAADPEGIFLNDYMRSLQR